MERLRGAGRSNGVRLSCEVAHDFKWLEYTHLNEISGVATTIGAGRRLKN